MNLLNKNNFRAPGSKRNGANVTTTPSKRMVEQGYSLQSETEPQ
jgi:hypothetical protein